MLLGCTNIYISYRTSCASIYASFTWTYKTIRIHYRLWAVMCDFTSVLQLDCFNIPCDLIKSIVLIRDQTIKFEYIRLLKTDRIHYYPYIAVILLQMLFSLVILKPNQNFIRGLKKKSLFFYTHIVEAVKTVLQLFVNNEDKILRARG